MRRVLCLCFCLAACAASAHADDALCPPDETLSIAAAELLLTGRVKPAPAQLVAAVREAGSDAVALHALFIGPKAPASAERNWLAGLRERSDAPLRCGRAQSAAGELVISSAHAGELQPVDPRTRLLRGSLIAGFTRAELVLAAADGELLRIGVNASTLERGVQLAPTLAAPVKIQLLATGPAGPRPIAERWLENPAPPATRPVGAESKPAAPGDGGSGPSGPQVPRANGLRPTVHADSQPAPPSGASSPPSVAPTPATPAPALAASGSPPASQGAPSAAGTAPRPQGSQVGAAEAPEVELAFLVRELREARGKRPLRDNRLLRGAAAGHARAVCEQGRVAHTLQDGRGPEERLLSAGLSARLVGEAIARAEDAPAAFEALQNSPSHLLTLLEPRFTDVGVAEARDTAGKRCYVVLLAAWPRKR